MAGFPERWMQELLARTDIVSVVSETVALKERGGRLWGLCPFHGEKTASFSVSADKQLYYCFGCHAGGNVVHFLMELEKLSYSDTIKLLAERIRLPMPEETDDEALKLERALKEKCYAACREAALFYHRALAEPGAENARKYLQKRGVDAKTIQRFGLGFSNGLLTKHMTGLGFSEETLLSAGLALKKDGELFDVFRGRVMFPIIAQRRSVIGFGARAMGSAQPKYLNSSETVIFNKRRHLYGLNFFRESRAKDIVLVEGYMDVVSLHQFGVVNAVASLGTAFSAQQARLIKRNAPAAYVAYDSDFAGQNATLKAAEALLHEGVDVRVMRFPEGMDPDEFIRLHGTLAFDESKHTALTFPQFKLSMIAGRYDLKNENARELYAKEACAFIRTLEPLSRERYYAALARETGFSLETLAAQGEVGGKEGYGNNQDNYENSFAIIRNTRIALKTGGNPDIERLERLLLYILVSGRECADEFRKKCSLEVFRSELYKSFAGRVLDWHWENPETELAGSRLAALMDELPAEQAKIVSGALETGETEYSPEVMLDCVRALQKLGLKERLARVQKLWEESVNHEEKAKLYREFESLSKDYRNLEPTGRV